MKPTLLSTVGLVLVLSQGAVAQTPDCCSPLAKAQPRAEMVCTLVICANAAKKSDEPCCVLMKAAKTAVQKTGKLIIAQSEDEEPALEDLLASARSNGVPDLELLGRPAAAHTAPSTVPH